MSIVRNITFNTEDQIFEYCSGKLGRLPNKYKKWKKSLSYYRKDWEFIIDNDIRENVAEQEMAIDYVYSLKEWLRPSHTFDYSHKLIFLQGICAIYEAVLYDYYQNYIQNNCSDKIIKLINKKIKKDNLLELIKNLKELEILDDKGYKYLDDVREMRNLIHLNKKDKKNNKIKIFDMELFDYKRILNRFRENIRSEYNLKLKN